MELSAVLSTLSLPASQEAQDGADEVKPQYTLLSSTAPIAIDCYTDLAELNNRVAVLAKHFNISVDELARGGHIVVFLHPPTKLNVVQPSQEVVRVTPA